MVRRFFSGSVLVSMASLFACVSGAGCAREGDEEGGVSEADLESVGNAAPSNSERLTGCDLAPLPAGRKNAVFRGNAIEYFSSEEIGYESANWHRPDAPWISPEGLDSSVLGNPGYPSPDRNYAPNVPVNIRISVVDVRNIEGKLSYHYFSNETGNSRIENWSSTKGLMMLQAGQTLRTESGGTHGLYSTVYGGSPGAAVSGDPSGEWMGTFITEVARSSDNGTAAWLKSITGGAGSTNFVRNWLDTRADFGGLHGESPRDLGERFKANDQGPEFRSTRAGSFSSTSSNTMMPIAMAEFWKRLAVNTKDPVTWLKKANYARAATLDAQARKAAFFNAQTPFALKDEDLKVLQYGYVNSSSAGGLLLGATQHPDFIGAFGGKSKLDALTGGKWRVFGKTGSGGGPRSAGYRSEAAFGGYICIPANPNRATLKEGRLVAFFINAQAEDSAGSPRLRALKGVANTMIPELNGATNLWTP
jgi:hypothetical protein